MLENKAQNSSGKQALRSTKFHALSRVTNEGYARPLGVYAHLGWRYLHIGDRSSRTVLDRQD